MSDLTRLSKAGRHGDVIAAIDAIPDPTPDQIGARAVSYFHVGRMEDAIVEFQKLFSTSYDIDLVQYSKPARSALSKLKLGKDAASHYWRECSDPVSLRMGALAERMMAGETSDLLPDFSSSVNAVFGDGPAAKGWNEAFQILMDLVNGVDTGPFSIGATKRKVIVSGTGWSGSGAVFDYLREFDDVFPMPGESTAFEGIGSFKSFLNAARDHAACMETAVTFFFKSIMGFFPMRSEACLKQIVSARRHSLNPESRDLYAQGAPDVMRAIAQLVRSVGSEEKQVYVALRELCNVISENMVTYSAPAEKLVLLDNCIHIQNVAIAGYLSNATLLCTFRDPRTNYIALKREDRGFSQTVEEFIQSQGRKRDIFRRDIGRLRAGRLSAVGSHVEEVLFEDFIIADERRREIAGLLDLDHDRRRKFLRLKPWESFRNTQLHLDYENPAEIEAIRAALPEYCVDFRAVLSGAES